MAAPVDHSGGHRDPLATSDCCVHVTHRCHDRQVLFRFAVDRRNYARRLRDTATRFDVSVFDYIGSLAEDSVVPTCLRAEGPPQWKSLRKQILERIFSPQLLVCFQPKVADPTRLSALADPAGARSFAGSLWVLQMGRAVGPRTKLSYRSSVTPQNSGREDVRL